MKRGTSLKILCGIAALALLLFFSVKIFLEPWVGKKIQAALNKNSSDYIFEIGKVHILLIRSGLELETITISSKQEHEGIPVLKGEIAFIKCKGIKLLKALFKNDINIHEVAFSNINIKGKIPFQEKAKPPKVSSMSLRIDSLFFDKISLEIGNTSTPQTFSVKDGILKMYDLQVDKQDTVSPKIVKRFDFDAEELCSVSADSMYTIGAMGVNYSVSSNTLAVDSFSIHPNYPDYEFAARHKFAIDRFEGGLSHIFLHDFSASDFIKSRNLISSSIEIERIKLEVFRDKRKESQHVKKPVFQDIIYNYPGIIDIDSIGIDNGKITYTEHVEKASEPGRISFQQLHVKAYKITNDTIYKTEKAFLELKCDALLMGKGKLTFLLKGRIFDPQNALLMSGTLSGMEISELNPMLEKNAFIYATSGKIDAMNFSFTTNNSKATGKLKMLYHGLNITVKNKRTDDTTAIKERVESIIANIKVLDSNPMPGQEIRVGTIDYERDPEKFLINYGFKSVLTGIKSTVVKSPEKRKK